MATLHQDDIVSSPNSDSIEKTLAKEETYNWNKDVESNGIIQGITKGDYRNEEFGITVTASSIGAGEAIDFISKEKQRCWTQNLPYSWFCVDFGSNRLITPSYYSFGYGSSGNACLPKYWIFQAAKKITRTDVQYDADDPPQSDPDWKTLAIHTNDNTMTGEWALHSWRLDTKDAYRYFRIVQTGPNSYNSSGGDDSWSQVLVSNRFELYGTINHSSLSSSSPSQLASSQSLTASTDSLANPSALLDELVNVMNYGDGYGSSPAQSTKYVPPQLIRAHPSITREIQELLVFFLRPQNESKAEKVKVHDIFV